MDRKKKTVQGLKMASKYQDPKKSKNHQIGKIYSKVVEQVGGHRYPSSSSLSDLQRLSIKYWFGN